jgi:hypothetical protein
MDEESLAKAVNALHAIRQKGDRIANLLREAKAAQGDVERELRELNAALRGLPLGAAASPEDRFREIIKDLRPLTGAEATAIYWEYQTMLLARFAKTILELEAELARTKTAAPPAAIAPPAEGQEPV